jgi:hypothetical protein
MFFVGLAWWVAMGFSVYVIVVGRIRVTQTKEWTGIRARFAGALCLLLCLGLAMFAALFDSEPNFIRDWLWPAPN